MLNAEFYGWGSSQGRMSWNQKTEIKRYLQCWAKVKSQTTGEQPWVCYLELIRRETKNEIQIMRSIQIAKNIKGLSNFVE